MKYESRWARLKKCEVFVRDDESISSWISKFGSADPELYCFITQLRKDEMCGLWHGL